MKLTPASSARSSIAWLVASSAPTPCMNWPWTGSPNVIAPKHSDETFTPVAPRFRYSMAPGYNPTSVSVNELLDVVFRWAHLIAGIMWIGNSMLFNWLDRNLEKQAALGKLSQGKIFMVHSGAFYDVEKKLLEPGELPDTLHWFKWQNLTTWLTGIALLVIVYFMNGAAFLVDPSVHDVGPTIAIT